jgi:hypothetical protein
MRKHLQPHNRVDFGDAMKVHLRVLKIGQKEIHLITLRPETKATFRIEYRHPFWRMYTGRDESNLLARLLWGLSYQKHPNTMILLDSRHIVSIEDKDNIMPDVPVLSPPLLILPTNLTSVSEKMLNGLKSHLKNSNILTKTIRWHTFGLDKALEKEAKPEEIYSKSLYDQEKIFACQGFICYTARPPILRKNALYLYDVPMNPPHGVAYWEMKHPNDRNGLYGEVQVCLNHEKERENSATMHHIMNEFH